MVDLLIRKSVYLSLSCIALGIFHFWLRWPAVELDYFHNEDTAGILYSADLILGGQIPLVDTVEMKAPGSFYLLATWWHLVGRSLYSAQLLAVIWSLIAAIGVGIGSWFLYRHLGLALLGTGLYICLSPFTDSMDINYNTWMITPYIGSGILLIYLSQRAELPEKSELEDRNLLLLWLGCGMTIALAALMKRQGAALFPLGLWMALRSQDWKRSTILFVLGSIITFSLFFSIYLGVEHGERAPLSFFFSESGWHYLLSDLQVDTEQKLVRPRLPRLWDGIIGVGVHTPLLGLLALLSFLCSLLHGSDADRNNKHFGFDPRRLLIVILSLSFCGASLGLRYFKGYYLQLLPALIWLAVDPRLWCWSRQRWHLILLSPASKLASVRLVLLFVMIASALTLMPKAVESAYLHVKRTRILRSRPLYPPTPQIKQLSLALNLRSQQTQVDDEYPTLWVWGRRAWPAYFYTQSRSPTRYFKTLGVLTTQLNSTWNPRRRSDPTRFDPQTPWREAIAELQQEPPRYIILSLNVPTRGFQALHGLLKQHYRSVSYRALKVRAGRIGELFAVYERRSP